MNYLLVILGIVLILVVYILYLKMIGNNSVLNKNTYLQTAVPPVDLTTLANPGSSRFAYSFWVYVNSLPSQSSSTPSSTPIFTVNQTIGSNNNNIFQISLNPSSLTLNVLISSNAIQLPQPPSSTVVNVPIMTNFPLQKWVYVVVSVDNKQMDLYVDGKIVNSQTLKITPALPTGTGANISFGTGDMFISTLNRQASPMDPQTAWSNYMSGNAGFANMFSTYGLNMVFSKDSVNAQTFTIF